MRLKLTFHNIIVTLLLLIISSSNTKAQSNPIAELNAQLRHLFSQLVNPTPNVRFLYDLSVHQVDSSFFTNYNTDTGNSNNWYMTYKEMYHGAYDTTLFIVPDTIAQRAITLHQHDTILLGLMEVSFNKLKNEAINTGDYFIFDTINDIWYDKFPRPGSPYNLDTLFIGAPLYPASNFADVSFRIDPQFFIIDTDKQYTNPDQRVLKIDFGDGNGWQLVSNLNTVSTVQVTYPSAGFKTIRFGTFTGPSWGQNADSLLQLSQSSFTVLRNKSKVYPDEVINSIDGIEVNVFDNNCITNTEEKYVIYLEGFDFFEDRDASQIYDDMIRSEEIAQLKNFGYKFLVVNWTDSHRDIKENAMSVVQLIDALKCRTLFGGKPSTDNVPPPFVVMSESMGGLIGRYALTYMESDEYRQNSSCKPEYMHNTRLFISIDAPQQGANVPLSVQHLYSNLAFLTAWISPFDNILGQLYKDFLFSDAAKQMLLYHVNTDAQFGNPIGISGYSCNGMKTELDQKLENMGNYPRFCKLMSLSNGALNGTGQRHSWDNSIRSPNDDLMSVSNETYLRVLGIKIIGTYTEMALHTNPDGNGDLINLSMGVSHWKIKLKWFGIKIVFDNTELLNLSKYGLDLLPYCTSAGSTVTDGDISNDEEPKEFPAWIRIFFGVNATNTSDGQGNVTFGSSVGLPFFANINSDIVLHSDGFGFGFIPTQSSLDFQADNPEDLAFDIKNQTTGYIMDRTPFDVLITRPFVNNDHLSMDNALYNTYETCNNDTIKSTAISREIGDDSLYVENITFGFPQRWEAEKSVQVGIRNPHYNYPDVESTFNSYKKSEADLDLRHLYLSKHNPVWTKNNATFRANDNVMHGNGAFDIIGGYQVEQGLMQLCCVNYVSRRGNGSANNFTEEKNADSYLQIYPNPGSKNRAIMLHYRFNEISTKAWATIYNINGQVIKRIELPFANSTTESYYPMNLQDMHLSSGIYYIRVSNGNETFSSKFVLTQ